MRWRQIAREDVVDCISEPEAKRKLLSGEVNCWKTVRGEWLRIVYIEEADAIIMVTVIYPAKSPKEGRT